MTERELPVKTNPDVRVEPSDMSARVVGFVALGILLYICLAPFVLTRIYHPALRDVSRELDIKPPAPILQLSPKADLLKFGQHEDSQLDSYAWVDRGKGIAHIPIDQAMKDVAARGIPDFAKAQP